jgi:hypothetical protein
VRRWLLDTGPLVAYLDAADREHARVVQSLDPFVGRLLTTGAVITEAMHLVGRSPNGPALLAAFASGGLEIRDLCRPPDLHAAAQLVSRYADVPMDFADATLLLLAEDAGIHEIATLDRRGFSAYRTRTGRRLRLVLDA